MADLNDQEITDLLYGHVRVTHVEAREGWDGIMHEAYDYEDSGWSAWASTSNPEVVPGLGSVRLLEDYYESGDYSGEMRKIFAITFEDGTEGTYVLEGTWQSYDVDNEWEDSVYKAEQKEVTRLEWVAV